MWTPSAGLHLRRLDADVSYGDCRIMNYVDDLRTAQGLWDHLPLGVFVADELGIVRIVNERVLRMTGWDAADQVVGRSALDFVVPDDLAFVVDGLARSDDFRDVVMGPFRVRYIARDGSTHWSECWAYHTPDGLGFDGHVVTIAAESVSERLATAMRGIASGADVDASLADVALALGAYPVAATASILTLDHGRVTATSGRWPLDRQPANDVATPWQRSACHGSDEDVPADELPAEWHDAAARAGFDAVWTRPVDVDGARRGVLVMWRQMRVEPTPNQQRHIQDALDVAALVFAQHDHRSRLARAAHTDHLTGAGNRARLDQAIGDGIHPSGVLYVDLDGFKTVNDRLGHRAGDDLLRDVAERLVRTIGPDDQLYRVGGDEFVVLAGSDAHPVEAIAIAELAERVVEAIGRPFAVDGEIVEISTTVGVAYARPELAVGDLLERADRALISAKRAGKRRWSDTAEAVAVRRHARPSVLDPNGRATGGLSPAGRGA